MLSRAHPGQKNSSRWMQSGWLRLCRMTWAIAGALLMGPLRSRVLVGACLGRGEELGDDLDGQVALGEPAERPAIGVDEEGVGDLRAVELRAHLRGRLAHVGERRLPQVDV